MGGVMLMVCLSVVIGAFTVAVRGEDPYLYFTWNVTYGTISPLGVPQQAILINGQFPGPNINSTTNNNIVVNRKNPWQDGVLGTNCPIPPGKNFTYRFQVKDQIGSYIYYPTTAMHRAAGGFGGLRVNSRLLIPVPYADPEDDYTVLIGDWHTKSHSTLRKFLDSGRALGRPDGVLINGKGNNDKKPLFTMKPGKTYKYRICNVGLQTSLNFRIQNHTLKLVEMEGSHTIQNTYDSLDVHVGQCYSVLVTADKDPKKYYMVASTRFTKTLLTAKAIVSYANAPKKGASASPLIPDAPVGWAWSLNQFRTFRWNLTASAARPNPQGTYHYGQINITRTIKLVNSASRVGGKLRYAINGVSHTDPATPLKLAEYYGVANKVFKYDTMPASPPKKLVTTVVAPNVLNQTFRNFVEIVFENHEKSLQSWHLDGYSFFAVGRNYNLLDAVSRHTIQVFPKSWAAILLTFDNAGMWNLRSELTQNRYLGQQMYVSVLSPERSLRDEYNMPDDDLVCGIVKDLPKPPPYTI
ncbi:hypothetical protein FEM48_Zijuj04G0001200 [Ziziphus jujuba var. spinosa]|uniref:L-ascorbate oxidase homolog n=1 Tax=Ziziphus jujuba var. spinosa TaxID=714518 RepID=A0A978VGP3_ZIZJJ|nr:hypothetical protein FEM48_Zijuj04G0001200 [Ziziphus jujuba var. spinosa]